MLANSYFYYDHRFFLLSTPVKEALLLILSTASQADMGDMILLVGFRLPTGA